MHLGHVVNAIYVWGLAGARRPGSGEGGSGEVLLRLEDHDRIRCRPEYEAAILEDLDWLGFVPHAGRHPVLRQSDEPAAYRSALDDLRRRHHVYACRCSRREIGGGPYDGRCRGLGLPWDPGSGIRVQMPEGEDILIRDRNGQWTYQFSVVVDDLRQAITHVIRGEDLLESTGRQALLGTMLGRLEPATFIHHPLILKPSGEKLSKSAGDTGVRELRAAGASPADVIGRAAAAIGLINGPRAVAPGEVSRLVGQAETRLLTFLG